jgi:hypothetical protein
MGADEQANSSSNKWPRRLGAALGAIALVILGAWVSAIYSNNQARVEEFHAAKNKCQHSLADTASSIHSSAVSAYERRFQEPEYMPMPDVYSGIKSITIDCFGPPLNWGSAEKRDRYYMEMSMIQNAWLARRIPDPDSRDHSREETWLMEDKNYLDDIGTEIGELQLPAWAISFRTLMPW